MILARVRGNVVSTNKSDKLHGLKLLIVVPIDIETFEEKGAPLVAIDAVGAGEGEVVMCVGGSSSRLTALTEGKPSDLSIAAIIDSVELRGKLVFKKFELKDTPDKGKASEKAKSAEIPKQAGTKEQK
jgi:ethanolamine utilization protein EutN/carbon dioxide concentrating mechanism protein CcmL